MWISQLNKGAAWSNGSMFNCQNLVLDSNSLYVNFSMTSVYNKDIFGRAHLALSDFELFNTSIFIASACGDAEKS